MSYDKDLKLELRAIWMLLVFNAISAVEYAFRRDWWTAGAFVMWFANLAVWLKSVQTKQRTRDLQRLTDAMLLQMVADQQRRERD
jgi:hypothetical protein